MGMNPDVKAQWVAALRSGEYKQGTGRLRTVDDEGDKMCCLGVLATLAEQQGVCRTRTVETYGYVAYDEQENYPPQSVVEWAGLEKANPDVDGIFPTHLNDEGHTFDQIADLIEWGL